MKILIVMDPGILVPPKGYGGHERLVDIFARQYTAMGHEVHLLVTSGSNVEGCTMHPFGKEGFPPKKSDASKAIPYAWKFLWKHRNYFDLIHNFGRLAYLFPVIHHPVKKIMTYGREISSRNIQLINLLKGRNIVFTACSANLLSRVHTSGYWEVVYNAIDFSKYTLRKNVDADAPLIFLGRIEKIKGCHTAIQVAKETNNKLVIAGNISPLEEEREYFEEQIRPYIDGEQIVYAGALNDAQKNEYLGKAKGLLFPIEWNEPFGIVMIEAMACGTPVIGFNRGSVNEVIDEGITGFKVDSYNEMKEAVSKLDTIDRNACRAHAEKRFDVTVIASRYLVIINPHRKNIVIVTTGQPAANPRVVKEYETFKENGYKVKVLYTYSASWSYLMDKKKYLSDKSRKQDFVLVGGNPFNQQVPYFFSRALFKVFGILVRVFPFTFLKEMTIARSSFYLWYCVTRYKADVYIAHYLGSLPAAVQAGKKFNAPVIFDAEDFHRGEEPYYPSQIKHVIETEDKLLPKVNMIIGASPLITSAYHQLYPGRNLLTINNVFSHKYIVKPHENGMKQLRLFWFSQNIGPNRGLEVILDAFNYVERDVSLHLLGNVKSNAYYEKLLKRSHYPGKIHLIPPVEPEQVFSVASQFDIGLAAEIPYCENRNICLTNKIFTYLMAGNCILASSTAAQADFLDKYPGIGLLYKHDDPNDLAKQIQRLFDDRALLNICKQNASSLAMKTMNWEHESGKLINAVDDIVNK